MALSHDENGLIPERPKVRNLISLFRPVGSSIVSFSVS